ncbi:MAG: DUF4428 domain-containing protein [Lachnospiraceae bacterium]|nr:DUF4428 domain-containing protein [Lachnospiraceae bacterium]
MGLFDKKYCDVCGEKISLLGNRKLDDGNLCKDCAKKLSPWFSERRHSTVESIKEQLNYRLSNQIATADFCITRTIGEHYKLIIDDINHKFAVGTGNLPLAENPDILDFSQAAGIDLKIDENRRELKQSVDGKQVSYNPPKYEYSYTFKATIYVTGNPYFDEMSFSISNGSVNTGEHNMSQGFATGGWSIVRNFVTAPGVDKYQKYVNIGNEMKEAIEGMRNQGSVSTPTSTNPQDPVLAQATESMRKIEELKTLATTGTPEQVQEYLNRTQAEFNAQQQQAFQPQMQQQAQSFQPQMQQQTQSFQPQMQQQASMSSVTCPYCGSAMTPTADGHCSVCNAPL